MNPRIRAEIKGTASGAAPRRRRMCTHSDAAASQMLRWLDSGSDPEPAECSMRGQVRKLSAEAVAKLWLVAWLLRLDQANQAVRRAVVRGDVAGGGEVLGDGVRELLAEL